MVAYILSFIAVTLESKTDFLLREGPLLRVLSELISVTLMTVQIEFHKVSHHNSTVRGNIAILIK